MGWLCDHSGAGVVSEGGWSPGSLGLGMWRADSHREDEHISRPLNLNVSPSLPRQPPLLSTSSVL